MKLLLVCVLAIFLASCAVFEAKIDEAKRLECTPVDSLGCSGWN
tara:strand:+ start:469 stop:600 length:132 start_codon:yes stop_codon:yes gene_type:complete